MTYQETLDFLFSQLPMYQRMGKTAFKKDLTNIKALCAALDNPQDKFKSIHIAGTNGKGSVTHILASILQAQGLKVACYTSPHYKDFRERIKINGNFISEENVIDFVAKNETIIQEIKPSFFEITVVMAFEYFAQENVDIAIIETGLGGRLDSTNIINPLLSIITNIGKDHTQFLGETLPEIAGEKAGIIKENKPVLIGEYQKETHPVFTKKALEENSDLHYARDFGEIENFDFTLLKETTFLYKDHNYKTDLKGNFQAKNIQTVLASLQLLKDFTFSDEEIQNGLKNICKSTHFIGRMMFLNTQPYTIADSAHNTDGIKSLFENINPSTYKNLHIVYGTVDDKDLTTIFPLLPERATYYFCQPNIPRGLKAKKLQEKAKYHGLFGNIYSSVKEALSTAQEKANPNDLIVVCGSIFVVAEVV